MLIFRFASDQQGSQAPRKGARKFTMKIQTENQDIIHPRLAEAQMDPAAAPLRKESITTS